MSANKMSQKSGRDSVNIQVAGDMPIVFNLHSPLTKEQVEEEFLKLRNGDFEDITNEVDETLRKRNISIFSYVRNYWLQLKQQLICEDFDEPWIPSVPADLGKREKKPYWQFTPIYQGVVLPVSYFFVEMDGGRYLIPLPTRKQTITKVQYRLGKALALYSDNYDDMLKRCKIEVVG